MKDKQHMPPNIRREVIRMFDLYLLTGATGFLGSVILRKLLALPARARVLVLPEDPLRADLPAGAEVCPGRVDDRASLEAFFRGDLRRACLIHCAGIVSIASEESGRLWDVNVRGTENILSLCAERGVKKVVYVSSVHAIPERPKGETIREVSSFSGEAVVGPYAKSKAEASRIAMEYAARGLDISLVHPSGILGPEDPSRGSVTGIILRYCRGQLPFGVGGGYDFVDVRDVADGVLACAERGRRGEGYILSNRYADIREILQELRFLTRGKRLLFSLPRRLVRLAAPLCEKLALRRKKPLFLTPYSVYTLFSNAVFSHEKATRELDYRPRELRETLADVVLWLRRARLIDT